MHIHFPDPALDPAVESKSLMILGPRKRPHLGARMIAIFRIGGTCSVTGRDLARSEPTTNRFLGLRPDKADAC
jgi:hypothetical protein